MPTSKPKARKKELSMEDLPELSESPEASEAEPEQKSEQVLAEKSDAEQAVEQMPAEAEESTEEPESLEKPEEEVEQPLPEAEAEAEAEPVSEEEISPVFQKIKDIMEDWKDKKDLAEILGEQPEALLQSFQQEGDRIGQEIEKMVLSNKIDQEKIHDMIVKWMSMVKDLQVSYIDAGAKIIAQRVQKMHETGQFQQ